MTALERAAAFSLLRKATIEVRRCRANVAAGGPVDFWIKRLEQYAIEHEQSAEALRRQLTELRRLAPGNARRP